MVARAMVGLCCGFLVVASCLVHANWLDQFNAACRARGGTPVHNPSGGGHCDMSRAGTPGGSGANPYLPGVQNWLDGLEALTRQNAAAGKQKRADMLQALEVERQSALRRQDTARAAYLAEVQRRLATNELQLKSGAGDDADAKPREYGLPGRHIFRNDIFTGQREASDQECGPGSQWSKPETCKARLTMKLGDDATASLRSPPQPYKVPTQSAPAALRPPEPSQDPAQVARTIAGFTPEERRDLLATLNRLPDTAAFPATAATPAVTTPGPAPSESSTGRLEPKLATAQNAAEALRAGAEDTGTSLESLKERAGGQPAVSVGNARVGPQPTHSPPAATAVAAASPSSPSPVDRGKMQRAVPQSTPPALAAIRGPQAEVAPNSSSTLAASAGIQTFEPPKLVLPRKDDPLSFQPPDDRDLFALLQNTGTPQELAERRQLAAGVVISAATVGTPDSGASGYKPNYLQREALIAHYAPELLEPYRRDNAFAVRVDAAIYESIRHGRDFRAKLDEAAWNRSGKPAWDSPQFRKERIDNAGNAQIQMSVHLAASLAELKRR